MVAGSISDPTTPYRVIAFTLFGKMPRYTLGMVHNARLIQTHFPGWVARVYMDAATVPRKILKRLQSFKNVELVSVARPGDMRSKLWRFHPALDHPLSLDTRVPDVFLSRDCDSRCDARDAACVRAWFEDPEGRDFHIIRDVVDHVTVGRPILAGLWGCKGRWLGRKGEALRASFRRFSLDPPTTGYAADELFLQDYVYPLVKDDCFVSVQSTRWLLPHERLGQILPPPRPAHRFLGAIVHWGQR